MLEALAGALSRGTTCAIAQAITEVGRTSFAVEHAYWQRDQIAMWLWALLRDTLNGDGGDTFAGDGRAT